MMTKEEYIERVIKTETKWILYDSEFYSARKFLHGQLEEQLFVLKNVFGMTRKEIMAIIDEVFNGLRKEGKI